MNSSALEFIPLSPKGYVRGLAMHEVRCNHQSRKKADDGEAIVLADTPAEPEQAGRGAVA